MKPNDLVGKNPFTVAVHAGTVPEAMTGAVMTPVFMTSTYVQEEPGKFKYSDYARAGNPTREAYEKALAALEGAKHGIAFSSGLAAVQAICQTLDPGAHVLVCDDVYGGTGRMFRRLFAKYGIDFQFIDMSDEGLLRSSMTAKTKLVWIETPTNPMMKVIDIAKVSEMARPVGARVVVDNTFASPIFQTPLALGADVVLHSTTKYIGGHSDMIGGALMLNDDTWHEALRFVQFAAGAIPGPMDCYLMHRSIKTLAIRMQQHDKNSRQIAEFLSKHAKVKCVHYPGLESHPQHKIALKQMRGYAGMISFDHAGSYDQVVAFYKKLKVFQLAESLGGVESLANHPEKMTHASVPEDLRKKLGIGPTLIRLSCGIEDAQDLLDDVKQALS